MQTCTIFCYLQPLLTSAHLQPPNSQRLFQGRPCIFQQDIPVIAAITKAEKFDISKLLHFYIASGICFGIGGQWLW